MWRWVFKSLLIESKSLFASIAAAAGAFLLVIFFNAVYSGEAEQVVAYVENADADVWVMQKGVSNMHMATSYLADSRVAEVRAVRGVAEVDAILYLNTVVESGRQQWFSYVVGLDAPAPKAGPWAMAEGRAQPGPGEVVVPAVFARMSTLGLGDTLRITNRDFTVVGLSKGSFSMANSLIFMSKNDLEDLMGSLDIVSYILVKSEPGVDPSALAAAIEREVGKVHALPADQFILNDRRMAMQMGVETIALMTVIGAVLAVLLVGFTIWSQITRQRRDLAVAKALGVTNRSLYLAVAVQAAGVSLASVVVAIGMALLLIPLAGALIPQVSLLLTVTAVLRIAIVGILVALFASLICARQVARVDPVSVFQS